MNYWLSVSRQKNTKLRADVLRKRTIFRRTLSLGVFGCDKVL